MRVCFTSDLHGRREHFEQLGRLLAVERPAILILGGDLFPDGDASPADQARYVREDFVPRLESWRAAARELTVATIVGNHDWLSTEELLAEYHERGMLVLLRPKQTWQHGPFCFLGYSRTPPTPHWLKDLERLDLPGDPLPEAPGLTWDARTGSVRQVWPVEHFSPATAIASELASIAVPAHPWIFVCHAPPHGTALDQLPGVTGGIGSRAVRRFIEQHSPAVSLHGHVHESPEVSGRYSDAIGPTLCINPGQGRASLHAVLFDAMRPRETLRHTVFS